MRSFSNRSGEEGSWWSRVEVEMVYTETWRPTGEIESRGWLLGQNARAQRKGAWQQGATLVLERKILFSQ